MRRWCLSLDMKKIVIFEIEQFNVREPMLYWIRAFPVALVLDWGNLLVTDEVRVDFRLIQISSCCSFQYLRIPFPAALFVTYRSALKLLIFD